MDRRTESQNSVKFTLTRKLNNVGQDKHREKRNE